MQINERPEFSQKTHTLTFEGDELVENAVKEMASRNYGASVIIDSQERVLGIFTERDLMKRVVSRGLNPATTQLKDVMTEQVKVAKATDNLIDWLRIMSNERFRHLPIVDGDGKLISMMSQGDFVSYTWPELLHRVDQQVRASLGGRYYPILIAASIVIYTVGVLFVFAR